MNHPNPGQGGKKVMNRRNRCQGGKEVMNPGEGSEQSSPSPSTPTNPPVTVASHDNTFGGSSTSGQVDKLVSSPMENNPNLHQPQPSDLPKTVFDICLKKTGTPKLKPSLLAQNRQKKRGHDVKVLRPGMVLLNNFISLKDQVQIVQTCRKIGRGNGGFYQPGYGDGAEMHLKMMCLGKHWDPKTGFYGERRSEDGAEPPPIPSEFNHLVQKAMQDTHAYILEEFKQKNVESVLPSMTPDICIVNFYTSTGRLGLHKDKDESPESLNRRLPVVSISIGDSAEFLYGDQKDDNKAEKVILESGDVLIFGGKSRHVYHGVNSIIPKSAPQALLQESDLRPGRLNLTFRQY